MSTLRIYAETGACLLNTGPEVDHDTDAIRRSMKEEVLLYYDPDGPFLRCYVQVQRAQPEQFAFEYEGDGERDVFEAFVREAREEVEKTNWRIIDENSAVFTALEEGVRTDPGTDESDVKALLSEGEPVEFAATDRQSAVGLVAHLREAFGDDHSLAISRAGRVDPVGDADFVIVPDQSYTGLTGATEDRLERVKVDYWRGELDRSVAAVAGGEDAAARLVDHVDREGIAERFDVEARPAARSWTAPARRWFGGVAVVGVLAVAAYLLATRVAGALSTLLGTSRTLVLPPPGTPLPGPLVDTDYPSWVAVAGAGLALVGGVASVGSVPLPSLGGLRSTSGETAAAATLEPDAERGVDECLDRIAAAADRETAVEALADALGARGVEVMPARTARLYGLGARTLGAGVGVAVAAGFYVVADPVLSEAVALLRARWDLAVDVLLLVSVVVLLGGVASRARSSGGTERSTTETPSAAPDRRSSAVSRQRVRRLLDRADDADYLKGKVDPERLLDELQSDPSRDDIAALLRAYEQAASVSVVPPDQRDLVQRSPGAGGPADASGRGGSERRPARKRRADRTATEPDTDPTPTEPDTDPTPTERERTRSDRSVSGDEPESVSRPDDEDAFTFGSLGGPDSADGDSSDRRPAAPTSGAGERTSEGPTGRDGDGTRADAVDGFPAFRYDDANSGYVRGREHGSGARPTSRWEYRTDDQPLPPVVVDGTVYVVDASGGVYAVDESGEGRWTTSVDGSVRSAPAVYDGVLYFGSDDGTVYAIDDGGEEVWSQQVGASTGRLSRGHAKVMTPPAVVDGTVYVGDLQGYLHARDARTGRERWRVGTKGALYGKPAVRDGTVFVANEKGHLAAYEAGGDRRWAAGTGEGITTTPAIGPASWYVVDKAGVVHRIDPSQGGAEVGTYPTPGSNPVSPTVGERRAFVGTRTGSVIALGADLEDRRWKTNTDHGDRILAPFLLDEGDLYVPAGRHVYAFDPSSGERHWRFRLKGEVEVQPAHDDGTLFVATASGLIQALDLE